MDNFTLWNAGMRGLIASMILLGAAGRPLLLSSRGMRYCSDKLGNPQAHILILETQRSLSQRRELTEELHRKCVEAGNRLQSNVAAMIPGRTWTWELDSEKSRSQLDGLRNDLKAFDEAEVAFEASLSPEQKSKLQPRFAASHALFEHLQGDAEHLDTEFRKGYPTRWHVTNDVLDMQKEINRWRKLHQRIADELQLAA